MGLGVNGIRFLCYLKRTEHIDLSEATKESDTPKDIVFQEEAYEHI